jgi:hypothetical protein
MSNAVAAAPSTICGVRRENSASHPLIETPG